MLDREAVTKCIHELLQLMMDSRGPDLFVAAELPSAIKVDSRTTPISQQPLNAQQALGLVESTMSEKQLCGYEDSSECNLATMAPGAGRLRVSAFIQQSRAGMVLRTINMEIPALDELDLLSILNEIAVSRRGSVIVVGATGPSKSTLLVAMAGYRNTGSYNHIITIGDPIEYVHTHQNCVVTQRGVGVDIESWHVVLRNTLRQAPNVILIGKIRGCDAMEYVIQYTETGHLCLVTLHANDSNQAIDRIISFFPEEKCQQLLIDLSLNLRATTMQRLLPHQGKKGRISAVGVMLAALLVQDLIFKGEVHKLKETIKKSHEQRMILFDRTPFDLYEENKITYEGVLCNTNSLNGLRLQIKLYNKRDGRTNLSAGTEHLSVV